MNPERWQAIKTIFETALEIPDSEQTAYLASACGSDDELRADVARLLADDRDAGEFLSSTLIRTETDGRAARPALQPGQRLLDRFEIVTLLGSGGMGEVYEAFDLALNARVALKTVRPELTTDERVLEQFRNEVQLARAVTHPNVCRIHDFFVYRADTGAWIGFLTMEFVEGETLNSRIAAEGALPEAIGIAVVRQIAEAVGAAHAAGILHRDLKTSNIMLTRDRTGAVRAVVMDFGIASASDRPAALQAGTPRYMSPEQRHGDAATAQSDIYALGVIAHEILTGAPPSAGDGTSPAEVSPRLKPEWRRAILRCLDADAKRRPAGAREFAAELDPPRATRRNLLLGVAATAGFAGVVVWETTLRRLPKAPSLAVAPFFSAAADDRLTQLGQALGNEVIHALTSTADLFVIGEDSTRIATASLVSGTGSTSRPTAPPLDDDAAARFARDAGGRLGVQYVLTGTLSQAENRMAVRVSLRSARDGAVLWAQAFAGDAAHLPDFRGGIARGVAGAVNVSLRSWANAAFARPLTANPAAFESYLLGRNSALRRGIRDLEQSLAEFTRAIELDNSFAEAYAGLAASRNILAGRQNHPLDSSFEAARDACRKALALSPALGDAHVVMASVHQRHDWNWPAADREYRAALASNPGMAVAHQWYSGLLSIRRLPDEAVFEAGRARELEPLSLPANTAYGSMLYRARRYAEAIAQLEFTTKLSPDYQPALVAAGRAHAEAGNWEAAIRYHRSACAGGADPWALSWLGYTLGASGARANAAEIGSELDRRWPVEQFSPSALAHVRLGMGDLDGAFRWLEVSLQKRDPSMSILRADPVYDPLRADSRYDRMIRELNL
jgi:eukaryotic-like serine/threonine-protein kinase